MTAEAEVKEKEHREHELLVKVLFNGKVSEHRLRADELVGVAIKHLLPSEFKAAAQDYILVDSRAEVGQLTESKTLEQAGVRSGDMLALNRRHGGGGGGQW